MYIYINTIYHIKYIYMYIVKRNCFTIEYWTKKCLFSVNLQYVRHTVTGKGHLDKKIHFQLLKHAYSGLKYEIQSKAFSETSSENSSTGNGIRMYTWHLSLWKIWILTAGEFVKRSHKGTCTLMIWKSRGGRFLHTGSVYNPVISGSIDKPSLPG